MDSATALVILGCASATALLNCGLRHQRDSLAAAFIVAISGGFVAIPAMAFVGLPGIESIPYLAASTVLGGLYWIFLGRAYASGEISIVYPLAFGSAPIWILILSSMLSADLLRPSQLAVVLLISGGLLIVLFSSTDQRRSINCSIVFNSIAVTALISAYTLCDAFAVRSGISPVSYTVFLYFSAGLFVLVYALLFHRERLFRAASANAHLGLFWGALSLVNYIGELWAMSRAPIALVAALRETSILFAMAIAIVWLKEPMHPKRLAGAGVVAFGLVLMRLS